MRVMMIVTMPPEPFNSLVRDGSVGERLKKILEDARPEAAYFTTLDSNRSGILVIDVADPSEVPRYAEPWFLQFDADVDFKIAMTAEDLGRAGLDELGRKWGSYGPSAGSGRDGPPTASHIPRTCATSWSSAAPHPSWNPIFSCFARSPSSL